MKKLTREEFLARIAEELGEIPSNVKAVPCNCGTDCCCGWTLEMKEGKKEKDK